MINIIKRILHKLQRQHEPGIYNWEYPLIHPFSPVMYVLNKINSIPEWIRYLEISERTASVDTIVATDVDQTEITQKMECEVFRSTDSINVQVYRGLLSSRKLLIFVLYIQVRWFKGWYRGTGPETQEEIEDQFNVHILMGNTLKLS